MARMKLFVVETEDGEYIGPLTKGQAAQIVELDPEQKAREFELTPYENWLDMALEEEDF